MTSAGDEMTDADRTAAHLRYGELQYAFIQFLTEHLVDCRKVFKGDLDAVVVLAILGQNFIRSFILDPTSVMPANGSTSASRISDVTGIPRETVRRKLLNFEKKGWIVQFEDGSWCLTGPVGNSPVRHDLSELDQRGMARMLRFHAEMSRIMAKQGKAGG